MKRKFLLLAILMIVGAWGQLYAQKDVTSQYITNAKLENNTDGWTKTFSKKYQTTDPADAFSKSVRGNNTAGWATEAYAGWGELIQTEYSIKQTITLPKGNYTLVNYSFFRQGQSYNTNSDKSLAVLKAGDAEVTLKTLGSISASGYADSQLQGANCFDSKMYRNEVNFTIDADNTSIEIGVEGTFDEMRSWCIVGMFELILNDELATMDSPFDVTGYITNPGFEYRDMTGWTMEPEGIFGTQSNNQGFKVGGWYAEKWQASGALPEGKMSQTLTNLPAGLYQLTANLGGNGTYIDLNGKTANWTADKDYTVSYVLGDGEDLTISAGKTAEGTANWVHFDNFKLAFCGDVAAALTTLCAEVTKYQDILPAEAYSALVDAVDAKNKSYSDLDELLAAISDVTSLYSDADALATAYADYLAAIDAAQTLLATQGIDEMVISTKLGDLETAVGTTVSPQTAEAYIAATATINQALASVKGIVDALTTGIVPTNDLNGWAISTTNGRLEVNIWSHEGETDGSGMLTPFVQDWASSGTPLAGGNEGGMLYYTFNGLIPGNRYTISALVRVYNEANTGVTGASFFVGDDIKALDEYASVCGGSANKGKYATFNATGEVDANGVLKFGVLLDSTSPINWIAIKDVTIQEASGILPTSITLDPTTLTLKTGETGTITATVIPEDAEDKTIVWTSSDENVATVANGIVSAMGGGSATITATALADNTVVATATVTVNDAPDIAHKSILSGDGGYLIRNVATGMYLGAADTYGTHGSLVKHGVIAQVLGSSGGYTITDICNATSGLGDNCYADNGTPATFAITPVDGKEKIYTIALGSTVLSAQPGTTILDFLENPNSTLAQWEFIDEADRLANLQEASESNPQDATYYIMDPNFSRNNGYYNNWTFEASDQKNHAGLQTNLCVESYHSTFNMEQTLIVPNGTYKVSAQGFYRIDNGSTNPDRPVFFANEATATFPERTGLEESMDAASTSFLAGSYTITPFTVEVKDCVLKIGARLEENKDLWCIWDNFSIEMVEYSENQGIDVKIGNVGYSTLYYGDVDLVIPSGVTAYTVTMEDDAIVLNELDGTIPAGTGVVLEGAAGTYTFDVSLGAEAVAENMLQGTDVATTVAEDGYLYYVLSTKAGSNGDASTVGFYWATEDGTSVENGAHKAYLALEKEAGAASFYLFDFLNGINNAEVNAKNAGEAYTLSGIRVNGKLNKGIYIVNGKKVVVK